MGRGGATLPVALAALSGCVLKGSLALQQTRADATEMLERTDMGYNTGVRLAPPKANWLSWWTGGSRSEWLTLYNIQMSKDATAIVTHAGKNKQEFIDHAVMLGISLKRHMPDYPMIALGVKGMTDAHQRVLEEAGWHVVLVADWRFSTSQLGNVAEGGPGCSNNTCIDGWFMSKHQDSLERLNIFRLPVGRVLYLDADTYVTSGELNSLLNGTDKNPVPEGNIGMVPNGCRKGYSAGVMLFKPNLTTFQRMLVKAAEIFSGNTTKKTDEQIIGEMHENHITALDRKYNCMDPFGLDGPDKCQERCTEVVVSHFFGDPKPTIADHDFLKFVRKPSGAFEQCYHMNHGSCKVWSNFYCDLEDNYALLSRPLQNSIRRAGSCCHTPALESDPEDCNSVQEICPDTVSFNIFYKHNRSVTTEKQVPWFGNYAKTIIAPDPKFNGGRPVYAGPNNYYMFYGLEAKAWMVGWNYQNASSDSHAHDNHALTKCPENTKDWKIDKPGFKYQVSKETAVFVLDPNTVVDATNLARIARRTRRFVLLKQKHMKKKLQKKSFKFLKPKQYLKQKRLLRQLRRARMREATMKEEATAADNSTADETAPEDKTTADGTAVEDTLPAGEMPNGLGETM